MSEPSDMAAARPRLTPFRGGVLVGLILTLGIAAMMAFWPEATTKAYNIEVVSQGADVSLHGGVKIVIANERGATVETCNGPCDDLRFEERSTGDNVYRVQALDAAGRCVACDQGQYVTADGPQSRWTLSGKDKLASKVVIGNQ